MSKAPVAMKDYPLPKEHVFKCPFPDCPWRPQKAYAIFLSHLSGCNRAKGHKVYHCIYYFGHVFTDKTERDSHERTCSFILYGPRYKRENTVLEVNSNQKTLFSGENNPLPPQINPDMIDIKTSFEEKKKQLITTFMYSTIQFDEKDIASSLENALKAEVFGIDAKAFSVKEIIVLQVLCCRLGLNLKPDVVILESLLPISEIDKHLKAIRYDLKEAKIACLIDIDIKDNTCNAATLRNLLTTNVGIIQRPEENEVGIILCSDSELISDTVSAQLPFKRDNLFYLCVMPYALYAETVVPKPKESYFFEDRDIAELTKKRKAININSEHQQKSSGQDNSDKLQREIREIWEKIRKEERDIVERLIPYDAQIDELEKELSYYRTDAYNLKKEENRLKQRENTENTQRAKADLWLKQKEKELKEKIKEDIALEREALQLAIIDKQALEDSRKGREETKKEVAQVEKEIRDLKKRIQDSEGKIKDFQKAREKPEFLKEGKDDYVEELLCAKCRKRLRKILYLPCKCLWKCAECHNAESSLNPFKAIQCENCNEAVKDTVAIKRPDNFALCSRFMQNFKDLSL